MTNSSLELSLHWKCLKKYFYFAISVLLLAVPHELLSKESKACAISVTAPADRTINIRDVSRCDTTIFLFPASFTGHCSSNLTFSTSSPFGTLSTNGGMMNFHTGSYWVAYTVADDCGMSGTDTMIVTIYNAIAPNIACIPDLVIHLNNYGDALVPANTFNAGSTDNCNHVYFKAKRMRIPTYSCPQLNNPLFRFDDNLNFCCRDVDSSPITIILRAYDIYPGSGPVHDTLHRGHYSECMVMVRVMDKLAPDLICPPNVTVQCGLSLDSILARTRPTYADNCSSVRLDSTIDYQLNACGAGRVIRTYVATDSKGQSSQCSQVITVLAKPIFNGLDTNQLKWPKHITLFSCRANYDTSLTGLPIIVERQCDNVLFNFTDDKFYFSSGGVCAKVLRNWTVINWCVYRQGLAQIPANGVYKYQQEIKIMDTLAPVIDGAIDVTVDIETSNCGPGFVLLEPISASDCGDTSGLRYRIEVDLYTDHSIDRTLNARNASGSYPLGTHAIHYYVKDSCNKEAEAVASLTVLDGKSPSAVIIHGLSTSLTQMANGCMVMINASRFNTSSSDNCTAANLLKFSFSDNPFDSIRSFDCSQLGINYLDIFVWDEALNYTSVHTFILVTDESNCCSGNTIVSTLSGHLQAAFGSFSMKEVKARVSNNSQILQSTYSNQNGEFIFKDLPSQDKIKLNFNYNDLDFGSITTADIVKIQKHILGIEPIQDPYVMIAADVDRSGSVSAADIAYLRSIILGNKDFKNSESHVFIPRDMKFKNVDDAPNEVRNYQMNWNPLSTDVYVDLVGIKIGDINKSSALGRSASAKMNGWTISYSVKNNGIQFYSETDIKLYGFQLGLRMDPMCPELNFPVSSVLQLDECSDCVQFNNESIKLLYTFNKEQAVGMHQELFFFPMTQFYPTCNNIQLMPNWKSEVVFSDGTSGTITLVNEKKEVLANSFELKNWTSDPFHGILTFFIESPSTQNITFELISVDGKIVKEFQMPLRTGLQEIQLKVEDLSGVGVFFINMATKQNNELIKLIIK